MKNNMTKKERQLTARMGALLKDWRIMPCGNYCWEVENWSPCDEDIIITLRGKTLGELAHDAEEAWENFDADEHAAEILTAKRGGDEAARRFYAAAPDSLSELLKDAEAIDAMYKAVYVTLDNAARNN